MGTTSDCLNDNVIKITSLMSMCMLNAKRPQTPMLTLTVISTNMDGPIFLKLLQMDSLTTKRNKTALKSTKYGVKYDISSKLSFLGPP